MIGQKDLVSIYANIDFKVSKALTDNELIVGEDKEKISSDHSVGSPNARYWRNRDGKLLKK
jgi:hypothetical protein